MNLLIDIGNSRLKWALENQGEINKSIAIAHQPVNFIQQLKEAWQSLEAPKILALSSVSTESIKKTVLELAQQLWQDVHIIIAESSEKAFGVINSYHHAQKLGVDRWLCLLATHHTYPQAAWIVDCGTAITVDLIDENGIHQGGLITAGLQLMKKSLLNNTAALNFSETKTPLGLAKQTDHAIFNGTLYAAIGLIETAVNRQQSKAVLILTGGDAQIIAQHLSLAAIIEPNLVLKGLAVLIHKSL